MPMTIDQRIAEVRKDVASAYERSRALAKDDGLTLAAAAALRQVVNGLDMAMREADLARIYQREADEQIAAAAGAHA